MIIQNWCVCHVIEPTNQPILDVLIRYYFTYPFSDSPIGTPRSSPCCRGGMPSSLQATISAFACPVALSSWTRVRYIFKTSLARPLHSTILVCRNDGRKSGSFSVSFCHIASSSCCCFRFIVYFDISIGYRGLYFIVLVVLLMHS